MNRSRTRFLLPFVPYLIVSAVHVIACFPDHPLAGPTKLLLMPALALAAVWSAAALRPVPAGALVLLTAAILCAWVGDGAAVFFPMLDDELPMMLLWFGLAHIGYLLLMWRARGIAVRRVPGWAAVYIVAYVALMTVLIPRAGAIAVPVAAYGALLVGTAIMTSRGGAALAWGGAWFLLSDAILSLRLFLPELLPEWIGGVVMLAYTLGQGLIVYGIVAALRRRTRVRRLPADVRPARGSNTVKGPAT